MKKIIYTVSFLLIIALGAYFYVFVPRIHAAVDTWFGLAKIESHEQHAPGDGHNHEEEREDESVLALSDQALANIGIDKRAGLGEVKTDVFTKTFTFPAVIEERPAATLTKVPSPVSGVIEKIYIHPGQMIEKGQPLFDIKLTREEVIAAQAELLMLLQKRDIIQREIDRLSGLEDGLAPQAKRDSAFQKLENDTAIEAKRNMLILNGLPEKEVAEELESKRQIISKITVFAPVTDEDCINGSQNHSDVCHHHHQLDDMFVKKGESVSLGDPLCQISDMDQLLIRGIAFAYNEDVLRRALENNAPVTAEFSQSGQVGEKVTGLKIRNISNRINTSDRTLDFYIDLTNELESHDEKATESNPYLSWRFKPGQRGEVAVAYEKLENCIVVPIWAIAKEQSSNYVFEWIGLDKGNKVFKRREVHVLLQTKDEAAIANDGSLLPGATIALRGASQLQVALDSGSGKLQSACPCGEH